MIDIHVCAVCGSVNDTIGALWDCERSHSDAERQRVIDYRRAHPEEFDDYRGEGAT